MALRMSRSKYRLPAFSQFTQTDLALSDQLDLESLLEAHSSRATQPVVDLARTDGGIKALPEGGHGDPMLLEVGFELH